MHLSAHVLGAYHGPGPGLHWGLGGALDQLYGGQLAGELGKDKGR